MQKVVTILAKNESDTERLAAKIACYTVAGDFIRLEGTLGMGKTTFARAFVRALSGEEDLAVPSPTFNLMQIYDETRLPVVHVDAYRMTDPSELDMLDLSAYYENGVTLMEWCSNVEGALPVYTPPKRHIMESEVGDFLTIELADVEGELDQRKIILKAQGTWCHRFGLISSTTMRAQTNMGRVGFLQEKGFSNVKLEATSPDCSFRTYYRFQNENKNYIVMDAPPPVEDVVPFIAMANFYSDINLKVPTIFETDVQNGYLLLEDLGEESLNAACQNPAMQEKWLNAAVDILIHTANSKKADVWSYSAESMWQEAKRFTDWYLPYVTGHATHTADRESFKNAWFIAFERIQNLPQTTCHWDYHVDNLMCLNSQNKPNINMNDLALIDFQDARIGPISMDMACLLEDRFPADEVLKQKLIHKYIEGLKIKISYEDFMAGYNLCLAHRFFKITGLLVRLEQRDKRENMMERMDKVWQTLNQALKHEACTPIKKVLDEIYPQYKEKVA